MKKKSKVDHLCLKKNLVKVYFNTDFSIKYPEITIYFTQLLLGLKSEHLQD